MNQSEVTRTGGERTSALPLKCGTCAGPLDSPVLCQTCGELQLNERLSHFELLGLPPSFELDADDLRRRFIQISRKVHPDRLSVADSTAQTAGLRVSAQLNAAYEILADPLRRAEYLLELSGGSSSAADKSVPQDVLMKSLTQREELEDARAAGDESVVAALRARVAREYEQYCERIFALARQLPGDEALRKSLRLELNTVKYYTRFREQAQE